MDKYDALNEQLSELISWAENGTPACAGCSNEKAKLDVYKLQHEKDMNTIAKKDVTLAELMNMAEHYAVGCKRGCTCMATFIEACKAKIKIKEALDEQ